MDPLASSSPVQQLKLQIPIQTSLSKLPMIKNKIVQKEPLRPPPSKPLPNSSAKGKWTFKGFMKALFSKTF